MAVDDALVTSAVDPHVAEEMAVYGRLQTVRMVVAPDLTDLELQLYAMVARAADLDPFKREIYAIKRGGRVTYQTGIDGFRASAEKTGEYRGSDEPEFGPIIDRPFPHPEWARVIVHRQYPDGSALHQPATVWWDEFYPGDAQGAMWKKMPRNQLGKCAEAAGFRRAFPRRFGQVYAPEEMAQADAAPVAVTPVLTARERAQARLAAVVATDAPGIAPEPAGEVPVAQAASPAVSDEPDTPAAPGEVAVGPSVAASPDITRCEATSPYEGHEQCRREAGHEGLHKTSGKESWAA